MIGIIGTFNPIDKPLAKLTPTIKAPFNPGPFVTAIASILSAAMMADYLGYEKISLLIREAVQKTIENKVFTPDLGGTNSTEEVIKSVEYNLVN